MALNSGKDEDTKTIQLGERIIFLTNSTGATGVSCAKNELGPLFLCQPQKATQGDQRANERTKL